jgi:phage terminase large subunit
MSAEFNPDLTTHRVELPEKLIPVFTGPARFRGAFGGRGSAKTRSFATMAAIHGAVCAQAGISGIILCAREFQNSLEDSSMAEVKAAILADPWLITQYDIGKEFIRTKCGRVSFSFVGLRLNVNSIKSKARILLCWVDEAEPVAESVWKVLVPSVREDNSEIWVTWNPLRKGSATDVRFRNSKDADTKIVELNWRDNPKFPSVLETDRLRDFRDRPEEYEHVWEGAYATAHAGSYWAKHILEMKADGRYTRLFPDPLLTIRAFADIGGTGARADNFVFWMAQFIGHEIRVLDYYEVQGQPIGEHLTWLRNRKYDPSRCQIWLPHDGATQDKVHDASYESAFKKANYTVTVVPNQGKGAATMRIEAVRNKFPQITMNNSEAVEPGLTALNWYHRKIDEQRGTDLGPDHDWSSHASDAFGLMCVSHQSPTTSRPNNLRVIQVPNHLAI